MGKVQRRALAELLSRAELRARTVFVACHHAPFRPSGRPDTLNHGLLDAAALLEVLHKGGATALGHGHIHKRYRIDKPDSIPVFCAGSSTEQGRAGFFFYDLAGKNLRAEAVFLAAAGTTDALPRVPLRTAGPS